MFLWISYLGSTNSLLCNLDNEIRLTNPFKFTLRFYFPSLTNKYTDLAHETILENLAKHCNLMVLPSVRVLALLSRVPLTFGNCHPTN